MKSIMMTGLFLLTLINCYADGCHEVAEIRGKDIHLQLLEHGMAGSVKNRLIFGHQMNTKFGSKLSIREGRTITESTFEKVGDKYLGAHSSVGKDGKVKTTTLTFVALDKVNKIISFDYNGEVIEVSITSDDFINNHFINPKFVTNVAGEEIAFQVNDGQACYGCAINFVYMILASYLH
jgi:hypothetical protein